MRTAVLLTLVLAAAPDVLVAQDEEAKTGLSKLEGTWVARSREYEGKVETKADLKGLTLVIAGDRFAFKSEGGQVGPEGTLAAHPSATPKSVDVKVAGKDGKEMVLRGIYELDGDTLRTAVTQSGGDPPKDFTAEVGSNVRVTVYQRSRE
jgi:uncharacterized protein (TIGR03067 family)